MTTSTPPARHEAAQAVEKCAAELAGFEAEALAAELAEGVPPVAPERPLRTVEDG